MSGFAEDYFDARARFLKAAGQAGLAVETIWHPTATALNGAPLAMDVTRAGREDASHVLFTVCGTHGVEGYSGSAAQVQLLTSGQLDTLPDHVAVIFLHALNPYAWSRDSQRNEDGIDINRNFIDFGNVPKADTELVERFAALMDIKEMSYAALGNAMVDLFKIRDEVGGARFMDALVSGQYVDPRSPKFGGTGPSWSNAVYRDVVRRYLGRATHVAELDWHTGLGAYGETFAICLADRGTDAFDRTCDWWGRDAVEAGMGSWSDEDQDVPSPEYFGVTHTGLIDELRGDVAVAGGIIEFGTIPVTQIPQVVFLDHWLLYNTPADADVRYWRAQMRTFMAPRERGWERSVLRHADRLYTRTLDGLARWGRSTDGR